MAVVPEDVLNREVHVEIARECQSSESFVHKVVPVNKLVRDVNVRTRKVTTYKHDPQGLNQISQYI